MRAARALALLCLLGLLGVAWTAQVTLGQGTLQEQLAPSFLQQGASSRRNGAMTTKTQPQASLAGVKTPAKSAKIAAAASKKGAKNTDSFPNLDDFFKDPSAEVDLSLLPPEIRTPLQDLPPLAKCPIPTKMRVRQEPYNSHLAVAQPVLQALIGEPHRYASQEVTVEGKSFSCVDSRHQGPILGTPGGDFGEFLVALSVMEELNRRPFTSTEVHRLLAQWAAWDKKGNFSIFHHTDDAAVRNLAKGLHVNGMAGVVTDLDLRNPPEELKEEILRNLNQTNNQGSHVIKAFMNFPQKFLIRRELTDALIRSYYALLWDRKVALPSGELLSSRFNLQIYDGEPKAKAWLSVRSTANCEINGAAHGFSPRNPVNMELTNPKLAAKLKAQAAKAAAEAKKGNATTKAKPAAAPAAKAPATLLETFSMDHDAFLNMDLNSNDASSLFNSFIELDTQLLGPAAPGKKAANSTAAKKENTIFDITEVFVHHPHAVSIQRKWLSRFFALQYSLAASQPKVYQLITRRQQAVTETVAEMLGRNVPFYTVTVE